MCLDLRRQKYFKMPRRLTAPQIGVMSLFEVVFHYGALVTYLKNKIISNWKRFTKFCFRNELLTHEIHHILIMISLSLLE